MKRIMLIGLFFNYSKINYFNFIYNSGPICKIDILSKHDKHALQISYGMLL